MSSVSLVGSNRHLVKENSDQIGVAPLKELASAPLVPELTTPELLHSGSRGC